MECRKSQRLHWNHPSGDWRALTRFLLGSLKSFLLPAQCSSCLTALLQRGSKLLVLHFRLSLELHNYIFLIFYQLKNPTTLQCHCTDYRIFLLCSRIWNPLYLRTTSCFCLIQDRRNWGIPKITTHLGKCTCGPWAVMAAALTASSENSRQGCHYRNRRNYWRTQQSPRKSSWRQIYWKVNGRFGQLGGILPWMNMATTPLSVRGFGL